MSNYYNAFSSCSSFPPSSPFGSVPIPNPSWGVYGNPCPTITYPSTPFSAAVDPYYTQNTIPTFSYSSVTPFDPPSPYIFNPYLNSSFSASPLTGGFSAYPPTPSGGTNSFIPFSFGTGRPTRPNAFSPDPYFEEALQREVEEAEWREEEEAAKLRTEEEEAPNSSFSFAAPPQHPSAEFNFFDRSAHPNGLSTYTAWRSRCPYLEEALWREEEEEAIWREEAEAFKLRREAAKLAAASPKEEKEKANKLNSFTASQEVDEDEKGWSVVEATAPTSSDQLDNFDGMAISANMATVLSSIKHMHPSCLSSLRLRSKPQRCAAYGHLVQLIR